MMQFLPFPYRRGRCVGTDLQTTRILRGLNKPQLSSQFRPITPYLFGRDEKSHPGGMVPEKPSYTSRFALKFAEILGAGLATAVSGYLVAHVGGYLSWPNKPPAPTAAVEALPSGGTKTPERPRSHAAAPAPGEADTHTAAAHDDHSKESAPAKAAEVSPPATTATPAPADNDEKRSRGGSASHKAVSEQHPAKPAPHESAEAKARETIDAKAHESAESKTRETAEAKTRETSEAKTREEQAVEEQVRAALANVDASRTPPAAPLTALPAATPLPQTPAKPQPLTAPTNPAVTTTAPAAAAAVPPKAVPPAAPAQPLDTQNAASVSATVPSAPVVVSPAQQSPAEPGPLSTVEIKSLPVAGVAETSPAAPAQPDNEQGGKTKEVDKGFFSAITHLPDMLRADAHGPGNEPPRPPMPVGQ
jgi:hypothetical protein